jgi:hypothetical protein
LTKPVHPQSQILGPILVLFFQICTCSMTSANKKRHLDQNWDEDAHAPSLAMNALCTTTPCLRTCKMDLEESIFSCASHAPKGLPTGRKLPLWSSTQPPNPPLPGALPNPGPHMPWGCRPQDPPCTTGLPSPRAPTKNGCRPLSRLKESMLQDKIVDTLPAVDKKR